MADTTSPPPRPSSSLKSMETEREKFRTYMEKSGVMSALTEALVHLYEEPERPNDALNFMKNLLGVQISDEEKVKSLEDKIQTLEEKIKELEMLNASQQATISDLERKLGANESNGVQEMDQKNPPA